MEESKVFKIRHSLAHILAMAVLEKFPDAKLGIGPVIDNGFYYDFSLSKKISDEDLPDLEARMKKIVQEKISFTKTIATRDEALKEVEKNQQNFKTELINDSTRNRRIKFLSIW
jgi:threonyl-tRNA synthetase